MATPRKPLGAGGKKAVKKTAAKKTTKAAKATRSTKKVGRVAKAPPKTTAKATKATKKQTKPKRVSKYQQSRERNARQLEADRQRIANGSIPAYVRVKDRRYKGRKFRNVDTGEIVTEYYYYKVLRPEILDQNSISYSPALEHGFFARQRAMARVEKHRSEDLIQTYQLKQEAEGNPLTNAEVIADDNFQTLVEELRYWSSWEKVFATPQNLAAHTGLGVDEFLDELLIDRSGMTPEELRVKVYSAIVNNDEYKRVLVELGRRDPTDDRNVGGYGPGYVKHVIIPMYQAIIDGE